MSEEEDVEQQDIFEYDKRIEKTQQEKLAHVKANRDDKKVAHALGELDQAINQNENLMPYIVEAVQCYASLGEICGVMRDKWGEYSPPIYI
jgi:methylmalonyl-CoA mutase N-terminal domain/subunit